MHFARMIELTAKAREAGVSHFSEEVNDRMAEAFKTWLAKHGLDQIGEEEKYKLQVAFDEGDGICLHGSDPLAPRVGALERAVVTLDRRVDTLSQRQKAPPAA